MTTTQFAARLLHAQARVIEQHYVNGEIHVNVIMPNGKPRTWRVERPDG
jgi:hypothetical protein